MNERNLYDCTRGSRNICEESSMVHFHASTSFNDLIASSSQLRVIFYHPNNTTISQVVAIFYPQQRHHHLPSQPASRTHMLVEPLTRYRTMASQSPSNCGSPNDEAEAQDRFTTMPSEILLKIITQLPSKYFLDLVQTCRMLRNFIKINASRICNEKIRSQFDFEAKLLQSELQSGWLVPTSSKVKEEEAGYNKYRARGKSWVYPDIPRCFNLLGEVKEESTIGLSLTTPGPQFLHFLEQDLLDIRSGPDQEHWEALGASSNLFYHREKVVIDGDIYFFDFSKSGWGGRGNFREFMDGFNRSLVRVEEEQLVALDDEWSEWEGTFPRELIWFYGVERLRIMEEGEAEDWKKLPVLLWE